MTKTNISSCKNCTGCSSCFNICPTGAIQMEPNTEGFLYPKIVTDKCIDCGLCAQSCPVMDKPLKKSLPTSCYAAINENEEQRLTSSSGGIFPILAQLFIEKGGYVCGAAFTEQNAVEHIIVSDLKDLPLLYGSKYLQSKTGTVYKQIKKLLDGDKKVLFSGTPCQVAGLKAFLRKDYSGLLCVDILCHGVPSPKVYQKYIQETFGDEQGIKTNFRDKKNGWVNYDVVCSSASQTKRYRANDNIYMRAFLDNISIRKSCGSCPFAGSTRQGDLSLGDFWRIENYNKKYNDNKGTSLILVNNSKGKEYLSQLKAHLRLLEKVPFKYAAAGNQVLTRPSYLHHDRAVFFDHLDTYSLEKITNFCLNKKCDCAILNLWFSNNFGALFTCYGLQEALKKIGYLPRVVNYIPKELKAKIITKNDMSQRFAEKYLHLTPLIQTQQELYQLNEQTETFIVGSDQVWREAFIRPYFKNTLWLDFVRGANKRLSYAASFGVDYFDGDKDKISLIKYFLKKFDAISVREDDGLQICQDIFDVSAKHVLDPVFLLSAQDWEKFFALSKRNDSGFIASYVLDKATEAKKISEHIREHFQTEIIDMADAQTNLQQSLSPEDWLYNIKHCKLLVTDSFHGVCFAIIFNRPFICIINKERGASRFLSLLKLFGLSDYIWECDADVPYERLLTPIDYHKVNQRLAALKQASLQWLQEQMAAPKQNILPDPQTLHSTIEYLLKEQQVTEASLSSVTEEIYRVFSYRGKQKKLLLYKILSVICFGKARKKYKKRKQQLKAELKAIKKKLARA